MTTRRRARAAPQPSGTATGRGRARRAACAAPCHTRRPTSTARSSTASRSTSCRRSPAGSTGRTRSPHSCARCGWASQSTWGHGGSLRSARWRDGSRPSRSRSATARLLLAKNPAGFGAMLDLVAPGAAPVVVAINARVADGLDPSWLYDVEFERLARPARRGDGGAVAGPVGPALLRRRGPRVRGGPAPRDRRGPRVGGRVDVVANYTAFAELHGARDAADRHDLPGPPRHLRGPGQRPRARRRRQLRGVAAEHVAAASDDRPAASGRLLRRRWRGRPTAARRRAA